MTPRCKRLFQIERLEDRITPDAPGMLGGLAPLRAETLFVEMPVTANFRVVNFQIDVQVQNSAGLQLRLDLPVFQVFELEAQAFLSVPSNPVSSGFLSESSSTSLTNATSFAQSAASAPASTPAVASSSTGSASSHSQPTVPRSLTLPALTDASTPVPINQQLAAPVNLDARVTANFAGTPLRVQASTPSGASDLPEFDLARVTSADVPLVPAIERLSIMPTPIPTAPEGVNPLPPSGGAGESQPDNTDTPPEAAMPGEAKPETTTPMETAGAAMASGIQPADVGDAVEAFAAPAMEEQADPIPEMHLLLFGAIAAGTVGAASLATRRDESEEAERVLLESKGWLVKPRLN